MFLLCEISCGEMTCGENKGKENTKKYIFPANGVTIRKVLSKNKIEIIFREETHYFNISDVRIESDFRDAFQWLNT
jgi:hypothetical protein